MQQDENYKNNENHIYFRFLTVTRAVTFEIWKVFIAPVIFFFGNYKMHARKILERQKYNDEIDILIEWMKCLPITLLENQVTVTGQKD